MEDSGHSYYSEEPEEEDRMADKLARKDSLAIKLSQRPERQELIDRNILHGDSDEERRIDRSLVGAKLVRRLSLRPSFEELEERNILKSIELKFSQMARKHNEQHGSLFFVLQRIRAKNSNVSEKRKSDIYSEN